MHNDLAAACLLHANHFFPNLVLNWVELALILRPVVLTPPPDRIKFVLSFSAFEPVESRVILFCTLGFHGLYIIPCADVLSVMTGVFGCGCPISSKDIRKGMAALQL